MLSAALTLAVVVAAYYVLVMREQLSVPPFTDNAIWLGVGWVQEPRTDEEIRLLAQHLSDYHIRDVYVYVSFFRNDTNEWNEPYDYARSFVRVFKEAAPDMRVLSWLGVPVDAEDGTYRLGSETVQARVAQFAKRTVEQFGFDGVHLNVELILDGNEDFLLLLETTREEIGPDALLSVSVPPDWNPGLPEVPAGPLTEEGFVWSQDYKKQVGALVDQVAAMAYNSGLESPTDYETWVAYQVEQFSAALADLPNDVELIIGVPAFEENWHDSWVESLRAALHGVHDGLERAGDNGEVVVGVGLYAFWDVDAVEWALYRAVWLNAP